MNGEGDGLGLFLMLLAVLAALALIITTAQIHFHHEQVKCEKSGGVWIQDRDIAKCLYGVRTKP